MAAGIHKGLLLPPYDYMKMSACWRCPAIGRERSKHPTPAAMRLLKASPEHCRSASWPSTPWSSEQFPKSPDSNTAAHEPQA
jgi:hypothetical protein